MDFEQKVQISDGNLFNNLLTALHTQYDYPLYLPKWCLKSKYLLLLYFEGEVYNWEKELLKQNNTYFLRPVKFAFDQIARRMFIPALRQYYSAPVEQVYFTERCFQSYRRSGYALVLFHNAIFGREKGSILKGLEDILSNRLAKAMRNLTGRGPKAVKTVVFNYQTCVHIVNGFLSAYEQTHLAKATASSPDIVGYAAGNLAGNRSYVTSVDSSRNSWANPIDMITYSSCENIIKEMLYVCYSYADQDSLQLYIELDLRKNQMCILVIGNNIACIPESM